MSTERVRRRVGWAALVIVTVLVAATACRDDTDSSFERIQREGFVRAAYAHEPPFAFLDDDGRVTGESPSALRGALPVLAVDSVRWVQMDFDELLPGLLEGRVDVVASGLFPTDARRERVAFTSHSSCSRPALLVREDGPSPDGLGSFVGSGSGRLAVVRGTVEEDAARELGIPGERLLVVPDLPTGVLIVREGRADALALTEPTLTSLLGKSPGLSIQAYAPREETRELVQGCSALAVRRSDVGLLDALNKGLDGFVGTEEHKAVLERFGFVLDGPSGDASGVGRGTSP